MKDNLESLLQSDRIIVGPAVVRLVGPDAATPGAIDVVADHLEEVTAFLYSARTQTRLGGLPISRATFASDDLDIHYSNVQGQERIDFQPRVPKPPPSPGPVIYRPPQLPTYTPPDDEPIVPQWQLCLMVLYKSEFVAAIPMTQLDGNPADVDFVPVYAAGMPGSNFSQPTKVGQYVFAGLEVIHTDVDLSGKNQAGGKSMLSTTNLIDATPIGRKTLPLMNSQQQPGGQETDDETVTLYTSAASFKYTVTNGFQKDQSNQNTQQCHAIDTSGNLYYGTTWNTSALVIMTVAGSDADNDVLQPALTTETQASTTYVPFYDVGYTNVDDQFGYQYYNATVSKFYYYIGPVYTFDFLGNRHDGTVATQNRTLTVVSTVIPNSDPSLPPGKQNLNPITEILGTSYYGTSTYTSPMTFPNIVSAHDDEPYYEWVNATLYYEYNIPSGNTVSDYSNTLYRMSYGMQGTMDIQGDKVTATATASHPVTTQSVQNYPGWGGNLIAGLTSGPTTTTYFDYDDGGGLQDYYASQQQIVGYTTTVPQGYQLADGGNSYGYAKSELALALAEIETPTCSPNGGPGPITVAHTNAMQEHLNSSHDIEGNDPPNGYIETITDEDTTNNTPEEPLPLHGYKMQTVNSTYNSSIQWGQQTITGSYDATSGVQINGAITVYPFPLGTAEQGYGAIRQSDGSGSQTCTYVTPYKNFTQIDYDIQPFTGWMHVQNDDHVMQGFIIGTTPYIYLDGVDVTAKLALALGCQPTDIAACYMDIPLITVQNLAQVE